MIISFTILSSFPTYYEGYLSYLKNTHKYIHTQTYFLSCSGIVNCMTLDTSLIYALFIDYGNFTS